MTVYASKIESALVRHESAFGQDHSGTLSSYDPMPFREGTGEVQYLQPTESPMHVQQRVDGHSEEELLPRAAVFTFETNLCTADQRAASTVQAQYTWQSYLMETWLGAYHAMTGTTVNDVAADTNDATVTAATTLRPGAAIAMATGTGGVLETREIASKSGSNVVWKYLTTNAPADASVVYGSGTYFANPETTGAEFKSLQMVVSGMTPHDRRVLIGGGITGVEPVFENGQIARIKWTVDFAGWLYADGTEAAADLNSGLPTEVTYGDANPIILADSEFCCVAAGGEASTVEKLAASMIQVAPKISYAKPRTPGGVNTVLQFVRFHVAPCVELKFRVPYEGSTWHDRRDNRTACAFWLQLGSSPADGAQMWSLPKCQVKDVQRVDVDGLSYLEVTAVPRHDTGATAESGYEGLAQSAFRVHVF